MAPGCQMVVETPCVQFGDYLEMHNNYHSAEGLQRLLAPYFAHVRVETEGPWYVVVATRDAATSQSQGPARPRYSAAQAAITSA